jgi:hypothetical protein
MKNTKKILVAAMALTFVSSSFANAALKVTASPTKNISQKGGKITLKFLGMPKTHGVYVEECMAPAKAGAQPTVCDSDQSTQVWASTVKADLAQGASNAAKPVVITPAPYWAKGDCVHTKCILQVVPDHNAPTDMSVMQAIPFSFATK